MPEWEPEPVPEPEPERVRVPERVPVPVPVPVLVPVLVLEPVPVPEPEPDPVETFAVETFAHVPATCPKLPVERGSAQTCRRFPCAEPEPELAWAGIGASG